MSSINIRVDGLPIPYNYRMVTKDRFNNYLPHPRKIIPDKVKRWRERVAIATRKALPANHVLWDGPIAMSAVFYFPRLEGYPKDIDKAREKSKWLFKWKKPDLSNLIKAIEDSMTKLVYTDDSRIVDISTRKYFTDESQTEGVLITLREIETGYEKGMYFCGVCGALTKGTLSKGDELWPVCEKCWPIMLNEMKPSHGGDK